MHIRYLVHDRRECSQIIPVGSTTAPSRYTHECCADADIRAEGGGRPTRIDCRLVDDVPDGISL